MLSLQATEFQLYKNGTNTKIQHSQDVDCDVCDSNEDKHISHSNCGVEVPVEVSVTDLAVDVQHHKSFVQEKHFVISFVLHGFQSTDEKDDDEDLDHAAEDRHYNWRVLGEN